ncbi:YceI family protein [Tunicatimonas pelagia]|uniref:YceI family protein n=1 Tax=Tunicatimonas pelagia TaxID=931531 RepID=UPI002665EDD0|nr:YceI family protein [Tunicatimonas pelagia]WKN44856.1 YceI family protein [Tunicatimonas pelagia]
MSTHSQKVTWHIDPEYSSIHFKIRHSGLATLSGSFDQFEGTVETENDQFAKADIRANVEVASINTGSADRDAQLRSADLLQADRYPYITFISKGLVADGSRTLLKGQLTIGDQTRPVTFRAYVGGTRIDPSGCRKAHIELSGTVHREAFDLEWRGAFEKAPRVMSDTIEVLMRIQLVLV